MSNHAHPPKDAPGYYWVRRAEPLSADDDSCWHISEWDGERWTNIGHEGEWRPDEMIVYEYRGPLHPPTSGVEVIEEYRITGDAPKIVIPVDD